MSKIKTKNLRGKKIINIVQIVKNVRNINTVIFFDNTKIINYFIKQIIKINRDFFKWCKMLIMLKRSRILKQ